MPPVHAAWVPPPTRRCTPGARCPVPFAPGSSAHAEMHRRARSGVAASTGFLRPRGDAPTLGGLAEIGGAVPPPTRRCTRGHRASSHDGRGSSAHAEMHRRRLRSPRTSTRFLRPRGDAPDDAPDRQQQVPVPPPTRRCTDDGSQMALALDGSSAHAEMHRASALRCAEREVPPPTRRCTEVWAPDGLVTLGSSAHAEMHHGELLVVAALAGFLRPRGDAPRAANRVKSSRQVPPPTRRCTRDRGLDELRARGSSAHAEMHRRASSRGRAARRFLRPRGDAPPDTSHWSTRACFAAS